MEYKIPNDGGTSTYRDEPDPEFLERLGRKVQEEIGAQRLLKAVNEAS